MLEVEADTEPAVARNLDGVAQRVEEAELREEHVRRFDEEWDAHSAGVRGDGRRCHGEGLGSRLPFETVCRPGQGVDAPCTESLRELEGSHRVRPGAVPRRRPFELEER